MNGLWVRIKSQGAVRDRERRERERQQLGQLVGANLERISRLEGLTAELYESMVLKRALKELVTCKDTISQSYLLDVMIQCFADELQVHNLDTILEACEGYFNSCSLRFLSFQRVHTV